MQIEKKRLFNVSGDDSPENVSIVNGNATGILNLNNVKYAWCKDLYRTMTGNFWLPEKVSMQEDKITIAKLTPEEDQSTRDTLSFLIFLDSLQVNNLPNISSYITDPAINQLITIQQFQEVIHSQSYQYILEALYPSMERDEIYNRWRNNPVLLQRNKYIADQYDEFIQDTSVEGFQKVLIANYALEGIYFYNGFNYFDQLKSREKLVQSQTVINYIRNDEVTHCALFARIIKEQMDTRKHRDMIYESLEKAALNEIEWSHETYGDRILGISKKSSADHVKWLTNERCISINLDPIWEGVENPYAHLEQEKRENFFEAGAVTEYSKAEAVTGWDDL